MIGHAFPKPLCIAIYSSQKLIHSTGASAGAAWYIFKNTHDFCSQHVILQNLLRPNYTQTAQ